MKKLYKAFYDRNIPVDVIPANATLSGYKIVILPQMIIAKPAFQDRIKTFVNNGGTLILTYRNAVKDADNNLPFGETVPVGYRDLAGVSVAETESLQDLYAFPVVGQGAFAGESGQGGIFRDMLVAENAEVLYRYNDPFYTQFAAVTRNHFGKGMVYYLGCSLEEQITDKIMGTILSDNHIDTIPSDDGVEVVVRGDTKQRVRMYINHNAYSASAGAIKLQPFECRIEKL